MRGLVRGGVESCAPPACGMRADWLGYRIRAQLGSGAGTAPDGSSVGPPPVVICVGLARVGREGSQP
jgi:hypothetical protein